MGELIVSFGLQKAGSSEFITCQGSILPSSKDDTIKLIEEHWFWLTTQVFGKRITDVSEISLNSQWWHWLAWHSCLHQCISDLKGESVKRSG